MDHPYLLDYRPTLNPNKIGISYAGAGPLLVVELGIAMALVDAGIQPDVIAGVSAGAITATAHALDPVHGRGILAAKEALKTVSDRELGLTPVQIAERAGLALTHLSLPTSLGDNRPMIEKVAGEVFSQFGKKNMTLADFGHDGRPKLLIGATDIETQKPIWFKHSVDVAAAMAASSAIPGIFPPQEVDQDGKKILCVDGGVSQNQPLSVLALAGCGKILAASATYTPPAGKPANLIDTILRSVSTMMHQASLLEEEYVRAESENQIQVEHIHPEVSSPIKNFDFRPDQVDQVFNAARVATAQIIKERGLTEITTNKIEQQMKLPALPATARKLNIESKIAEPLSL